jgi:hypothetical protein
MGTGGRRRRTSEMNALVHLNGPDWEVRSWYEMLESAEGCRLISRRMSGIHVGCMRSS